MTLPSSSSCCHEFNETGFVVGNHRTRLHAAPKDPCLLIVAHSPDVLATIGSGVSLNGSDLSTRLNLCVNHSFILAVRFFIRIHSSDSATCRNIQKRTVLFP
ncbi:hypothetical protein PIB30_018274 [Stylosanthes scabra]|uniref:Uncharacterized protein n=1 Tax=Stylosanthes scabra TaxID=79078 RepID=A0ABU6X6T5_9FABA|nr:hypothetical protein [Stylosanthes scabra]